MKKLEKSMGMDARAQKGEGIVCLSIRDGAPAVAITDGDGTYWVFPWANLIFASYTMKKSREIVELTYAKHVVRCEGTRLKSVAEGVARFAIEWLRCYENRYMELCPQGMPFIEIIEVTELEGTDRQNS